MNTKLKLLLTCLLLFSLSQAHAANPKKIKTEPAAKISAAAASTNNTVSSTEFNYQINAVPDFVVPMPNSSVTDKVDAGDIVFVLYDRQVSLLGDEPQEYVHFQSKALTASGLADVSQVYMSFNPAYQKLQLHSIKVWRDGKATDLTHSIKLDLMRRENNLDKSMYEGNVTAVGILPDTRVNDLIDIEYTVVGANPIFGKRFADIYGMTQSNPVSRFRLAVLTPESRPLKVQVPAGVSLRELKESGHVQYIVEKTQLKAMLLEDKMPDWYMPRQFVEVSEYASWKDVANWANTLFKNDTAFSPEIQKQLKIWQASSLTKEQLTVEVLRWVQTEVRYFGIELGVNSHLPANPNLTVERKFGDCKDKSLLLVSLLRALGIEAEPTLASLSFRRNVEKMMPSPSVFDHAIVHVTLAGKSYWLDATLPAQYGTLDKLGVMDYGNVLVLGGNNEGLQSATFPANFENSYQRIYHYQLSSFNAPLQLTSEIKANYNYAEYLRQAHEAQSAEEFSKALQDDLVRVYPSVKPVGDVIFDDDKINNQVTIRLKFVLEDFFQYEPGRLIAAFYAMEPLGTTALPKVNKRNTPYSLPAHVKVTESLDFSFPEDRNIKSNKANNNKTGEFWNFSSNSEIQAQRLSQVWTLKANKEAVPAAKISDYLNETRAIRDQMIVALRLPVSILADSDKVKIGTSLMRLDDKYGKSDSPRVAMEKKDALNLVVVSHDIASGKLAQSQLALAYKTRSQAYDNQGDVPHALEDILQARQLAPENIDYILSEADTLLGDGQFLAANQAYQQAIDLAQSKGADAHDAYKGMAKSLHYLGKNTQAKDMLDLALNAETGPDTLYSAVWRYIAAGEGEESRVALTSNLGAIQDTAWPYAVGDLMLDKISPDQLIVAAKSADKGIQEDQLTEAYFYIGQKYLLKQQKEKAREYFQKSIDLAVLPYAEYNFSLIELGKKREAKKDSVWKLF